MKDIVHIHSSSKYDRSPRSLLDAAKRYNKVADLITYTEVEFPARRRSLREASGNDFGTVVGGSSGSNDCAIVFKKARFELVHKENFQTTNKVIFLPNGKRRDPQFATLAVLRDKLNGKKFVVCVLHLASSVEPNLARRISTKRTIHWNSSFRGAKKRANRLRKRHKGASVIFVADFNVDFKKPWTRALVKSIAPSYKLTWKKPGKIAGGTLGRRIIDATLVRGRLQVRGSARLMKDDSSSDHRPYIERLRWKQNKRKES